MDSRPDAPSRSRRPRHPGRRRTLRSALVAAPLGLALAACTASAPTEPAAPPSPVAASAVAPVAAVPAGLVPAPLAVAPGLAGAPLDVPRQVLIPPGWSMSTFARVRDARLMAWAPDGTLLVSRPETGEVLRLVPDGRGGATPGVLLAGLTQPHGMTFVGPTLLVAESNGVAAYDYAAGAATNRRPVLAGLPDEKSPDLKGAYAHALKSVAVGPDGSIYVSIGSTANVSPQDRGAIPERATISRVPPGGGPAEPVTRGVRNGTGLAVAPDGAVWTAVNDRDQIPYPYDRPFDGAPGSSYGQVVPSYVRDHPPEELARVLPGRDLGYPFCNPDPDAGSAVPGTTPTSAATPPFTRDVATNADGSRLDCAALPPIEQVFGAHSAPLGLSFVAPGPAGLPGPWAQGALVGVHGSWNAQPPRAPEVSFFPYADGRMGAQQTLVGGFQAPDGSRWGRPVAAVLGPDGAVYVSDDGAHAVYRLAPPGR